MKKFAIICIALFSVASCKKEQKNPDPEHQNTAAIPQPNNMVYKPEENIKEAQKNPLTTVAFAETDHDFGKIKKGSTVEYSYTVTNTGNKPLIISKVQPGCGCTAPDYTKDPILPGKNGKITLKFDSSNFDGLINKRAEVFANVEHLPIVLTFKGDVVK